MPQSRFLNNYPVERFEEICELLDTAYAELPFSIVNPIDQYEQYLEEGDYLRAFKRAIDFFEIAIQYTSALLISKLNHRQVVFDDELKSVIKVIVDKPLSFGDWVNSIFLVLVKKGQELMPEDELCNVLFDGLYRNKGSQMLLGSGGKDEASAGIVYFRNHYFGHDTISSNNTYKEALIHVEARIWKVLELLLPLRQHQFFVLGQMIDDISETKSFTVVLDKGIAELKTLRVSGAVQLDEYAYYVTQDKITHRGRLNPDELIQLSPFVIFHYNSEVTVDEKFHYIFQTIVSRQLKRMVFISAHEKAQRKETELFKERFWSLLQRVMGKLLQNEGGKLSFRKERELTELQELALSQTSMFLNQQLNADKYDPNVFLEREYLAESYRLFSGGDYAGFIILGDAGTGKTNQICHWASAAPKTDVVLAYYSKAFGAISLADQLRITFNEPRKEVQELLENLHDELERANATAFVFFDAINECTNYKDGKTGNGALDLFLAIDEMFVKDKFSRFKIIVSCRSYTWEELMDKELLSHRASRYFTAEDRAGQHVALKGFTQAEFTAVYPKYADKFNLRTSLETLLEDRYHFVLQRLFDPLILKTASQNFEGREFPADTRQFDSTKLFAQRLKTIEKQERGRQQIHVLEAFTTLLWEDFADSIDLKTLFGAYDMETHALHRFAGRIFKNDSLVFHPDFTGLLEAGILRIDKGFRQQIRFVYERFNEFLFAQHFLSIHASRENASTPIPASAYEEVLTRAGHSTVIIASLRNALIMDYGFKGNDPATLIQLARSPQYEAQALVEETLSVLMDENYGDVFGILESMLGFELDSAAEWLSDRLDTEKLLASPKKTSRLSAEKLAGIKSELEETHAQLVTIARVRKMAISLIYKIFKSDRVEEWIRRPAYDPNRLLWMAMADPLPEVRDCASIYIYYIARYDADMGRRIVTALSDKVMQTPLIKLLGRSSRKELQQSYIEPACRVGLFLVIDGLIERQDYGLALGILDTWKKVVRRFSLNHVLIRAVMPFFKILLARQAVVQKEYVNNGIEYGHFWDTIPKQATAPTWSQYAHYGLVRYLDPSETDFAKHESTVLNAYRTGDSFSLFLLERVMVVQGIAAWDNIENIVNKLIGGGAGEKYRDYMELSLLYVLYQISYRIATPTAALDSLYAQLTKTWSIRCKGYYYAHYNDRANGGRPYKHYILNWYAAAYCNRYGDGVAHGEDQSNVPVFRELITQAYEKRDKALLYNCLENMAMLVATSGYHKTALQLFEYLLGLFKNSSEIAEFDRIALAGELYKKGLRSFICSMLGTVKCYFPKEVDHFIVNRLPTTHFPDVDTFKEEIFNHAASHEGIGDLLTHKFGNFVIWGILNDRDIRKFFMRICEFGYESNSYIEWFDNSIRHAFEQLFEVKNL